MRQNVLKFQNDIKAQVALHKETGDSNWWMHPAYCAYYIIKHKVDNPEEFIEEDIKKSYKALDSDWMKQLFKKKVSKYLEDYAETICAN